MARVACLADLHGRLPNPPPECDLVILAGDICPDYIPMDQVEWLGDVLRPWLSTLPTANVVAVAGNHDHCWPSAAPAPDLYAAGHPPSPVMPWTWLCDREATVAGLRVHGTPWAPWMGEGWAFQAPGPGPAGDEFLRSRYDLIRPGVDVLVSHAPPHGFRDLSWGAGHADSPWGAGEVPQGSRPLTGVIRRLAPRLVVCGHIHQARGSEALAHDRGSTLIVNCAAPEPDSRTAANPWMLADLPGGRADAVRV